MTQDEIVKKYGEQDTRLQHPDAQAAIRINEAGVLDAEKLFTIGKGTYEIHDVQVFDDKYPMRAVSIQEELEIKHATHVEMRNNPLYEYMKNDQSEFQKLQLIKTISLATSSSIHTPHDRVLKESDIKHMSPSTVAGLITAYQDLERSYNPPIGYHSEEAISLLMGELFNPEKKLALVAGLDLWLTRIIILRLLDMIAALEDNNSIVTSLEDISQNNEIEK